MSHLLGDHLIWAAIAVLELHIGLVMHPVEVLVQPVQQEGKQLLAVVLLVTIEPRRILPDRPL